MRVYIAHCICGGVIRWRMFIYDDAHKSIAVFGECQECHIIEDRPLQTIVEATIHAPLSDAY